MKKLIIILILTLTFTACSTKDSTPEGPNTDPTTENPAVEALVTEDPVTEASSDDDDSWLHLTLEELAAFNGKDQQPAYVAVEGTIYDVTNSRAWGNGMHNGFEAGKDLTEAMRDESPHGFSKLDNIEAIGTLVE